MIEKFWAFPCRKCGKPEVRQSRELSQIYSHYCFPCKEKTFVLARTDPDAFEKTFDDLYTPAEMDAVKRPATIDEENEYRTACGWKLSRRTK